MLMRLKSSGGIAPALEGLGSGWVGGGGWRVVAGGVGWLWWVGRWVVGGGWVVCGWVVGGRVGGWVGGEWWVVVVDYDHSTTPPPLIHII